MSLKDDLLAAGEKHIGTDLGGLLQVAAYHIESQGEVIEELLRINESMNDDCKRMHAGLIAIDAGAVAVMGIAFGAMPERRYAFNEPVELVTTKRKKKASTSF